MDDGDKAGRVLRWCEVVALLLAWRDFSPFGPNDVDEVAQVTAASVAIGSRFPSFVFDGSLSELILYTNIPSHG
jgi:hypothetical protein